MGFPARSVVLGITAGLLLATALADGDWREIPYKKFHASFSSVKPLEGARHIHLRRALSTSAGDMARDHIRMVIGAADGDIEVAIGPDGTLDFPMSEGLAKENPPVRVNVPEGELSVSVEIEFEVQAAQRFPYSLVTDVEDEYRRFVKQQGMLARMMAPEMQGLAIVFPAGEPGLATVTNPADEIIRADESGTLMVPLRKGWTGAQILLSRMPETIRPKFKD